MHDFKKKVVPQNDEKFEQNQPMELEAIVENRRNRKERSDNYTKTEGAIYITMYVGEM